MGGYRHLQVRHPVPGPVRRARQPDAVGRDTSDNNHARVGAQHPGPDVERGDATSWCLRPHTWRRRTELDELGYRYELDTSTADHLTLAINDQYAPAAEFLGTAKVARNPAHVTYVAQSEPGLRRLGRVADHAHWVSGVKPRDTGSGYGRRALARHRPGRPHVRSDAVWRWNPGLAGTSARLPSPGSTRRGDRLRRTPQANRIDLTATNVSELTITKGRAGVGCNVDLRINQCATVR